ncbi:MAG: fimbrillin family protein [Bacteroidaceae bacterium]|nr:fimbrillin family protein [Bacteroidaceae bacterium]
MNRLFGIIAKLMLTGIILTVASCAYDDTVRELRNQPADDESLAIAFSNGIIDNPVPTTKALALLSDHMESMGVWGWQTTQEGATERLFINQNVTFSATLGKWTYSPLKYWDSKSSYRFYAYAPHSGSVPGVTASINPDNNAISIKGVTLQGSNTIDSGVPAPPANFGNVADVDWMLDRTGQSMQGVTRNEVTFNMQHILSKICVRVRRSSTFLPDSIVSISIDSLKIGNFISQGDFVQTLEDASQVLAPEWATVDTLPRYTVTSAKHVSIPDSAVFVLESLLIPQSVTGSQYIRVWYNIGNSGGYISHMDNIFSLDELFGKFEAGKSYVITVIIGPDPIRFDAGVQDWTDNSTNYSAFSK